MSPSLRTLVLLPWALAVGTGCVAGFAYSSSAHHTGAARREVSISFYEVLSPHGDWVLIAPYGRVWRPHHRVVGIDFMPYVTGGRWVYTEDGWMFETDWEWGWAPFHYGRWFHAGEVQGWVWVPDTVWGPAWVEWRAGGGYVGWAPLPPRVVVGVHVAPPIWVFVTAYHFPDGRHRERVVIGPREHPATAVIPPRPKPDGHAWYVGPSRDWVSHHGSVKVYPRSYRRPDPLPPTVLDPPKDSRKRPPPGGEPTWGSPSAPERGNAPSRPPAGEPTWGGPSAPERSNPPARPPPAPERGNPPDRPPPPGKEHGSSPPPGHAALPSGPFVPQGGCTAGALAWRSAPDPGASAAPARGAPR
jgi:hypothetical protein